MKFKAHVAAGFAGLVLLLCAGVSRADWSLKVSVDKSSPQVLSSVGSVTCTGSASGTGFSDVEYQFWLYSSASARYTLMRDYGADASWSWTPEAIDYYVVMVRARSGGSTASFDKSVALAYYVVSEAPVSAVTLSADKPSPQQLGTPVTFTASAAGGGSGGVEYQFWLSSSANRPYRLVKNYNESDGSWTPGPGDMDTADSYAVRVYARSRGSVMSYEKTASRSFTKVTQAPVTAVTLDVDKPSPQLVGTSVTFTATAAGGGAGGVEYQFWLAPSAGGAYRLVEDYPESDGTWTPAAGDMDAADCYSVLVYARSRGGAALFEKTMARSFCLVAQTPVTAVALSVDKPSPQPAGTSLTFTATAEGGDSGIEYRFWLATGAYGNYEPVGDATTGYSPSSLWHWQPPSPGSYRVMVYARSAGSVAPYERYTMIDYTAVEGDTTCEGCHSGSYPLAPDVMGDGTLPDGDPAHTTPKPYDDGTYGYNVNGHGRDADTNALSHGNRINVACTTCHDVSVPPGRHLDGVLDGRTPSAANGNPFHLVSGYIEAAPSSEWSVQTKFDDYCWTACHQGKTTDHRHLAKADPLPNHPEFGTYNSYAQPANTPPPEMFYDVNIAWLGAFNGPPNFVLCVSCHNPHGTNVASPNLNGNNKMAIYRWERPATLCSRCHL